MPHRIAVVIVAAGGSRRLPGETPKQWRLLGDMPLLAHAFWFFDHLDGVEQIAVALDQESLGLPERTAYLKSRQGAPVRLVAGGRHRQESVHRALLALDPKPEIVLIHDGARPFPPISAVRECIRLAAGRKGALLAIPVTDTIKRVDPDMEVVETFDRSTLWAAQTPQGFQYAALMEAYDIARDRLEEFTDDASIFEAAGGSVRIVEGSVLNLKVTHPEDFSRAERILGDMVRGVSH
ncbi:2-C-methyl-D-erythritol 4-phosphate cytidylyltransferase [bacterium]|nr:2-C-methyl-D-erythritol 4-phosphate cytidylyltransferase [bacterium]